MTKAKAITSLGGALSNLAILDRARPDGVSLALTDDLLSFTVDDLDVDPLTGARPAHGSHHSHHSHASHHSSTTPGHTSHASHASHVSSR